jgi:hypothetical protein
MRWAMAFAWDGTRRFRKLAEKWACGLWCNAVYDRESVLLEGHEDS